MSETQPSPIRSSDSNAVGDRAVPPFLTLSEVGDLLRLKRTAMHEVLARPDFPLPHGIGGRHRLWKRSEVVAGSTGSRAWRGAPCPPHLRGVKSIDPPSSFLAMRAGHKKGTARTPLFNAAYPLATSRSRVQQRRLQHLFGRGSLCQTGLGFSSWCPDGRI